MAQNTATIKKKKLKLKNTILRPMIVRRNKTSQEKLLYLFDTPSVRTEHTGKYLFLTEQCSGLGLCPGVVGSRSTMVSADCGFTVQVSLLNYIKSFSLLPCGLGCNLTYHMYIKSAFLIYF